MTATGKALATYKARAMQARKAAHARGHQLMARYDIARRDHLRHVARQVINTYRAHMLHH